jgi:hypothetical protein
MTIPEEALRAYGLSPESAISGAGGTKNANFCVRDGDRRSWAATRPGLLNGSRSAAREIGFEGGFGRPWAQHLAIYRTE